jgi:hypothetical protein
VRLDHITPKQSALCSGCSNGRSRYKPKAWLEPASNTQSSHTHSGKRLNTDSPTQLLDDHRASEPPDPIPNSEVKRCIADGSVGSPHVRVGHRQAPIPNTPSLVRDWGFSFACGKLGNGTAWEMHINMQFPDSSRRMHYKLVCLDVRS